MILRLLNPQGIAGLAAVLCLGALLLLQKGETRHWRKQSGQYEQLYRDEQAAFAGTVANYRAAADAARAADKAAAERVQAEQRAISERISNDYESRLATARAVAERLRSEAGTAAADPRRSGAAPMPGISVASSSTAPTAAQGGFPDSGSDRDWRLLATEQAIQLDELIKWVKAQAAVRIKSREPSAFQ